MSKSNKKWARLATFLVGSWAVFSVLAWSVCRFTLCARAQMWSWLGDADPQGLWGMGGLARAAGLWLGAKMATPAAAVILTGLLMALSSLFMLLIMNRISRGNAWIAPLALCPGVAMTLMLGNVYAPLSSPIALTVALGCACACLLLKRWWMTAAAAAIFAAMVVYFCGPWLMPGASYVPWLGQGATATPLVGVGFSLAAAMVGRFAYARKTWSRIFCTAISCVVLLIFSFKACAKPADEALCELSYYAEHRQWAKIENRCKSLPMADEPLLQNYWSLAMAEQCKLADRLFAQPWVQPRSIIDLSQRSPMAYMLFSDITWSMGQVGLAQRYAFEANEALGNSSPRMLKRLAETNLAYGQEAVAKKYGRLLGEPVAMNSDIEAKRRGIPSTDAFSMNPALEPDLLATLRANPELISAMQYLGCMRLLAKDIPHFAELMREFCGTGALPGALPQHFKEGVAIAVAADGQANADLAARCAIDPSLMQACEAFYSGRQQFDESLWHYLRDYKLTNQ